MAQLLKKFSVHIAYKDRGLADMWKNLGFKVEDDFNEDFDILCFGGGEDINPFLYGERRHPKTFIHMERDLIEIKKLKNTPKSVPKVGICRGGQFLNVMSGGAMFQHVDGHATGKDHNVLDTFTQKLVKCTSTHHQMMIPSDDGWVIGVADESSTRETFGTVTKGPSDWSDTEVVWYSDTNSLCFQPHPEYQNRDCRDWFASLLDLIVLQDIKERREIVAEAKKVKST